MTNFILISLCKLFKNVAKIFDQPVMFYDICSDEDSKSETDLLCPTNASNLILASVISCISET